MLQPLQVKAKNKSTKDFGKLFLAQELFIPAPTPSGTTVLPSTPTDSASTHSGRSGPAPDDASQSSLGAEDPQTQPTGRKKNAVWSTKFSNDGKYLAVGGKDGVVRGALSYPSFVYSTRGC